MEFLINQGAALEERNKFGETPLWLSELAIQFYGGGTYQIVPTATGDLLRSLGATVATGKYPPQHGVISASTYRVGSQLARVELLPDHCFAQALV